MLSLFGSFGTQLAYSFALTLQSLLLLNILPEI